MKAENRVYEVTIADGVVTLRQKSLLGTPEVTRSIRVADITAVQFDDAATFSTGSMRFMHAGSKSGFILRPINHDKVEFGVKEQEGFRAIRDEIIRLIPPASPS